MRILTVSNTKQASQDQTAELSSDEKPPEPEHTDILKSEIQSKKESKQMKFSSLKSDLKPIFAAILAFDLGWLLWSEIGGLASKDATLITGIYTLALLLLAISNPFSFLMLGAVRSAPILMGKISKIRHGFVFFPTKLVVLIGLTCFSLIFSLGLVFWSPDLTTIEPFPWIKIIVCLWLSLVTYVCISFYESVFMYGVLQKWEKVEVIVE